jgi:fucose permease
MSTEKKGIFTLEDGRHVFVTFALVSSLFLLWGLCNGMIDIMDKHFQDELHLSLSQSAWVQFAHWMGYFLMSLPAGWLATRLGYKGGIIAGLLLVAVGGFWFIPASKIAAFWAFLLGVCVVASGLTFLETVANPYTTVLGPPRYAAMRINAAQSCNGVGWVFGPIVGGMFFYSTDVEGRSTGSQTLWIPYATIAVGVLVLAVVFFFAPVPDVKAADDYQIDEKNDKEKGASTPAPREVNRWLSYFLLLGNSVALIGVFIFILWLTLDGLKCGPGLVRLASAIPHPSSLAITDENSIGMVLAAAGCLAFLGVAVALVGVTKRLSHHSVWAHEHFSGATLAQFLYVAAQCGIFSFFVNYMVAEPPSLPASWSTGWTGKWVEVRTSFRAEDLQDFKDLPGLVQKIKAKSDPVSAFLYSELSSNAATFRLLTNYAGAASDSKPLALALARDFKDILKQDPKKVEASRLLYNEQRFSTVTLSAKTTKMLADKAQQAQMDQELKQRVATLKEEVAKRLAEVHPQDKARRAKIQKTFDQKLAQLLDSLPKKEINMAELNRRLLQDAYAKELDFDDSILGLSDKAASFLASFAFICFLLGRVTGAALLRRRSAHKTVGSYAVVNVVTSLLIFLKLGWLSVACVFVNYFFMSIMFPTIFALGIFGLGARAKRASAYIVMGIVGGALLPKLMGAVADHYNMSRGFIVPMICFALIALYGYCWPKLSRAESLHGVGTSEGH